MEGEFAVQVGVHDACVFDDVDVLWGPAGGDVGDDGLLEEAPVAGEADEEGGGEVDMGGRRFVPGGDRGEGGCGGGLREVVRDGGERGEVGRSSGFLGRFVDWFLSDCYRWRGWRLCEVEDEEGGEGEEDEEEEEEAATSR